MKRYIIIFAASIFFTLSNTVQLSSGQYIKIEKIDISTAYPRVNITITAQVASNIPPLDEKSLSIREDGKPIDDAGKITRQIASDVGSGLVMAIDSSKSIRKKFLAEIKSCAKEIVKRVGAKDAIAVYNFDDAVTLLNDFSSDADLIMKNIEGIERHGRKTLLYDAIYDSINQYDKIQTKNKKIMVFTDGKDEGSRVNGDELMNFARHAGIPLYFICGKRTGNTKFLASLSSLTSGQMAYISNEYHIACIRDAILSVKKISYVITYKTQLKPDDQEHKIEVRLNQDAVKDRDVVDVVLRKEHADKDFNLADKVKLAVLISLFCLILFIIIILFLYREKKILKDKFEIEKKFLIEKSMRGAPPGSPDTEKSNDQIPSEPANPELHYTRAWLFQKGKTGAGKKFPLQPPETTMGSDRNNGVALNDSSVSNYHAKIKNIGGIYYLFDLISEQGTFLNGNKLLRPKQLCDWDEIRLGNSILIFRGLQKIR
jgi:hypothetical protein